MSEFIWGMITGGLIVAWNLFLIFKISALEYKLKMLPTPEQLAKTILNMKIPLDDLPPDIKARAMELIPEMNQPTPPASINITNKLKQTYIG
jgi:hypothetical protein